MILLPLGFEEIKPAILYNPLLVHTSCAKLQFYFHVYFFTHILEATGTVSSCGSSSRGATHVSRLCSGLSLKMDGVEDAHEPIHSCHER